MGKKKKWIVSVVQVDEEELGRTGLPRREELSSLPDRLQEAISRVAPNALALDTLFLLTDAQKQKLETYLEKHSLPYHEYAVDFRGERCTKQGCKEHHPNQCVVIRLHDHFKSNQRTRRAAQAD
jgi:hypothetical protein